MRLLDLFCGAGGAAEGYAQAGFEVVGVDHKPQPDYPFEFVEDDVFAFMDGLGKPWPSQFDVVHASPPCQGYVQWNNLNAERRGERVPHPLLIEQVRNSLEATDLPYVIENVVGSPLRSPLMLCGSMFGLGVRRHRLFEANVLLMGQKGCHHSRREIAVYGKLDGRRVWTRADGTEVRVPRTLDEAQVAMGIDWMTWDELREAIPPAYTEFIGRQLIDQLARCA